MLGYLECFLDLIFIFLSLKIFLLPFISIYSVYVHMYMYIYIQYTYILTYILHTYVHATAILCIMNTHSYLKVEFILKGGAEVATLLSHTEEGCPSLKNTLMLVNNPCKED